MKDEDPELLAQKAEANAAGSSSTMTRAMKDMSNRLGVDVLMSLVAGKKMDQMIDTTGFMEEVRARAKRDASGFQVAKDPACVRPMLEVAWPAMLAVFSMSFEANEAASVVNTSLDGFCRAIHLAAVTGMESVRDAFILPLANLTSLHSPSNMRSKNIAAMRALVGVGVMDGNALGASWAHILKAVSRYDRLYSLATGYNDASLFERGSPNGGERKKQQPQPQPQPQLFAFASASKNSPVASSLTSKSSSASAMSLFGGAGVSSIFGGRRRYPLRASQTQTRGRVHDVSGHRGGVDRGRVDVVLFPGDAGRLRRRGTPRPRIPWIKPSCTISTSSLPPWLFFGNSPPTSSRGYFTSVISSMGRLWWRSCEVCAR